jgi:hypothetical protein
VNGLRFPNRDVLLLLSSQLIEALDNLIVLAAAALVSSDGANQLDVRP